MTQAARNVSHPSIGRRAFLSDMGLGFTGLVLGTMLAENAMPAAAVPTAPVTRPQVDNVIWLFMMGGVSHLESFDPKPLLNKYAGKTISKTPHQHILKSPDLGKNFRLVQGEPKHETRLLPLQIGFRPRGASGIEVSDWWPNVSECIDDVAVIRSMWTNDFNHSAQLLTHTGKIILDGSEPSLGSWAHYGLGSLNAQLPKFVVLGRPPSDFAGGPAAHLASYLGPEHDGVPFEVDPDKALPFPPRGTAVYRRAQQREFQLLKNLNQKTALEYPSDQALAARIKSYELAFEMQTSVPDIVRMADETEETQQLYGLHDPITRPFGQQCLVARRLVEKGVRFVQLYHGGSPDDDNGLWDSHFDLQKNHSARCAEVDRPVAALLRDLKRRGMLERTLVVWVTEFGRTPNVDLRTVGGQEDAVRTGRDHHIYGFSAWMAGGGIRGGTICGATDELGFHAVEDRHYITDVHATVLAQLGLDARKLQIPGRKRLEVELGAPIMKIVA